MEFAEILAKGRIIPTKHAIDRFLRRWKTTPSPNNPLQTMIDLVRRAQFFSTGADRSCEYMIADWKFVLVRHTDSHGDYLGVITCYRRESMGKNRGKPKFRRNRAGEKRRWQGKAKSDQFFDD